jgi:hypothetical protein
MKPQTKQATQVMRDGTTRPVLVMYEYPAYHTALIEYGPHEVRGDAVYARWAVVPMKELMFEEVKNE